MTMTTATAAAHPQMFPVHTATAMEIWQVRKHAQAQAGMYSGQNTNLRAFQPICSCLRQGIMVHRLPGPGL